MIDVTFIRQGTTPAIEITAIDEQISDATVYVTIDQGDLQLTKSTKDTNYPVVTEASGNNTIVTAYLSQSETMRLRPGPGKIQLRWIFEDGTAGASDKGYVEIGETLLKGVITYG